MWPKLEFILCNSFSLYGRSHITERAEYNPNADEWRLRYIRDGLLEFREVCFPLFFWSLLKANPFSVKAYAGPKMQYEQSLKPGTYRAIIELISKHGRFTKRESETVEFTVHSSLPSYVPPPSFIS